MRVGFDGSFLYQDDGKIKGGVGYYAFNLVQSLLAQDKRLELVLFLNKKEHGPEFANNKRVKVVVWPLYKYRSWLPFVYAHFLKAYILWREKLQLVHFPSPSWPLFYTGPKVVTVHDLAIYKNPAWFRGSWFYRKFLLPHFIKKAHSLIAVSQTTKNDLAFFLQIPAAKINMIYEGVNELPAVSQSKCLKNEELLAIPFLLFIGTIEPRKNLLNIIKAFVLLKNDADIHKHFPHLKLALAGLRGWCCQNIYQCAADSFYKNDIVFLGAVSEEGKEFLLNQAQALLYPSWYEGFGLPILEGFSHNLPVLTSNVGAMAEIADSAAYLVNPADIRQLALGMKKLLFDNNLRKKLIALGLKRKDVFSWRQTARQTLGVYKNLIQ